jgi:hypothetical protein
MSRIKDLLAVEQDIDDLKPVEPHKYGKDFAEAVRQADIKRMAEHVYQATLHQDDLREWLSGNAEYTVGEDDEGHEEIYFENFYDLCWEACEDMLDADIEEQHLDLDDAEYHDIIEIARDKLADTLADFEAECIQDMKDGNKYTLDELVERNGQC